MLNIDQPLRKYTLAIIRSIKDKLRDGIAVETDTGRLRNSLRMRQNGHNSDIYGMNYAIYLRNDRDFRSKRRRTSSTRGGFLIEAIEKADEKELDKLVDGIGDELLKTIRG